MICLGHKVSAWSCLSAQVWQESEGCLSSLSILLSVLTLLLQLQKLLQLSRRAVSCSSRKACQTSFFLQDCYACFPSGFYHLSGLGFRFPLDFCKSPSRFCFVCGVMIRFRKQLLRFRATWALMPTNSAGCQMTKIVGSVISRGSYGQKRHCNTYDALLSSKRLGCALVNKLNHGIMARSWIFNSKFLTNNCLDGKGMFMKLSISGKHGLLTMNLTSGLL